MDVSEFIDDSSQNYKHFSPIPETCRDQPCVLGIDEAGRGPVLGPMVYGISYCPVKKNKDLKDLGVDDSKALTEEQREKLLQKLLDNNDYIGWAIHILSPSYISRSMFKRGKYNLNSMSHDTAIGLVQAAIDQGVRVAEVYVDTVGPPDKYQAKLEQIFPDLKITVAKKADSLYPCVSAASICAKVARDKALKEWRFPEQKQFTSTWGSGYPGDAVTKRFLEDNLDPVFGFPSIVRFSWSTAEKLLLQRGVSVTFEEEEAAEDEEALKKNPSVKNYFVQIPSDKDKRKQACKLHPYFRDRCIKPATGF